MIIAPVPKPLLQQMFTVFGNQLMYGIVCARENIRDVAQAIVDGTTVMWVVAERGEPRAAFLTKGGEDDRGCYLFCFALAGRGLPKFARALETTLLEHARENHLPRVLFYGRPGWRRLVPSCRVVVRERNKLNGHDHMLFERVVQ